MDALPVFCTGHLVGEGRAFPPATPFTVPPVAVAAPAARATGYRAHSDATHRQTCDTAALLTVHPHGRDLRGTGAYVATQDKSARNRKRRARRSLRFMEAREE